MLEVEPRRYVHAHRAPPSLSHTINPGEARAFLGQTGRQVDPDRGVVRIPRAQIGRWYPDSACGRAGQIYGDTSNASVRFGQQDPVSYQSWSVLASCHSLEPSREEQTLRRPARILDRGSRRAALSKLRLESGPRALAAILDASARTRVAVPRWVEPRANSGSGDRGGVHAHSRSVSLTLAVERGHGSRIELPGD